MGCSLGEIIIVMVIAALVAKPQDIKYFIKQFHSFKILIQNTYMSIVSSVDEAQHYQRPNTDIIESAKIASTRSAKCKSTLKYKGRTKHRQMNFYLQKIVRLEGAPYTGSYNLLDIKRKYYSLLNSKNINNSYIIKKSKTPRYRKKRIEP